MDCNTDTFQDFLSNCNDHITLNALLTPGQNYKWQIRDKFGNVYEGISAADVYGQSLTIELSDLPAGLINSYGGTFALSLYDTTDNCKRISFKMTQYYDQVFFNTDRGTAVKDTLGCTFD